jgi:hypothetical protein
MSRDLNARLEARDISLKVTGARASVREALRAEGWSDEFAGIRRSTSLDGKVAAFEHQHRGG